MRFGRRGSNRQPEGRALADDEQLTQYGSNTNPTSEGLPFHQKPRPKDEGSLSMILGRYTPQQASQAIGLFRTLDGDGARYTTVGDLRRAGFTVTHSPTARNADHVSVSAPNGWTSQHAEEFNKCFNDVQWHEEVGGS